jgi:hypothetical protein
MRVLGFIVVVIGGGAVLTWITEVREMQTVPNSLDARGFKKFKTLQLETVFEGHKNKCLG